MTEVCDGRYPVWIRHAIKDLGILTPQFLTTLLLSSPNGPIRDFHNMCTQLFYTFEHYLEPLWTDLSTVRDSVITGMKGVLSRLAELGFRGL